MMNKGIVIKKILEFINLCLGVLIKIGLLWLVISLISAYVSYAHSL